MKNTLTLFVLLLAGKPLFAQPEQTLYHPNGKKYIEGRFIFVTGGLLTKGEAWREKPGPVAALQFPHFSADSVEAEIDRRPRNPSQNSLYNPAAYLSIVCEGPVTYHDKSGTKHITITYTNGVMNGPYTEYYAPGKKLLQGDVVNGMPNGPWTYYYPNGQPFYTGTYKAYTQAELKAIWTRKPAEATAQTADTAQGAQSELSTSEQYLSNKILKELIFFKMPMTAASKEGIFTFWHKNGHKMAEGSYTHNQPAGEWKIWEKDAPTPVKIQIKDGVVVAGATESGKRFTIQELNRDLESRTIKPWTPTINIKDEDISSGMYGGMVSRAPGVQVADPLPKAPAVYTYVELMPEFKGNVNQWLNQNMRYPESAKKAGIEGRVIVKFRIEENGSVSEAVVGRSINPELDAEALRLINAMPKWEPGKQNGKAVPVYFTIPVKFSLN